MNRVTGAFGLIMIAMAGVAAAASNSDQKARVDDCMAQQRANNPGMSKHDMKKTCKDQVKNTPHD